MSNRLRSLTFNAHWLMSLLLLIAMQRAQAQGRPPGFEGKPLPAYPGRPGDCYQLLRNQFPYIQGGDYPVCRAVLRNLNQFCKGAPQYDRRRIHPQTKDLREPAWKEVPTAQNLDLVKEAYLAVVLPKYREKIWTNDQPQVIKLAQSGSLKLFSATIDLDLRFGQQTLYKLQGYNVATVPVGYDQPYLMITTPTAPRVAAVQAALSADLAADLWEHQKAWYLIRFEAEEQRLLVKQLLRPRSGESAPLAALTRCTIMYATDNR